MTEIKRENAVNVKMNEQELKMLDDLCQWLSLSRSETVRYMMRDYYNEITSINPED